MTEREQNDMRIRYFAEHCAKHASELCPNEVLNKRGQKERVTWAQLFTRRHGRSPEVYLNEVANANP